MLKRHWKLVFIGLSQCVDVLALAGTAAFIFALNRHSGISVSNTRDELITGLSIFGAAFISLSAMLGYYRGSFHLNHRTRISLAVKAFIVSLCISFSITDLMLKLIVDRRILFLFVMFFPFFLFIGKIFLRRVNSYFRRKGYGEHPSLIAGFSPDSLYIYDHFGSLPELGYSVRGFITKGNKMEVSAHPQYTLQELEGVIEEHGIDRIFIPSTDLVVNGYSSLKRISRKHGIKLKVLSPQSRDLLKYAKVHDIAGITLTRPRRYKIDGFKFIVKRAFDIIGSISLIVLLSPVLILTVLLIWLEDGRPIFFTQPRGAVRNGKFFSFLKFRTMVRHADQLQAIFMSMNESDGALFKMKRDPRVTKIGRYLRKFSIDELPQLFNVLKGDMSLVGPRPLPPSDFEKIDAADEFWDAVKERGFVKPGMTGIWQVSGRSDIKFTEMILLDLYYVENNSFMFDLEILFETIPAVLFGKGAY